MITEDSTESLIGNGFGVEGERKRMDRERVKTQHDHHRERIGSNKLSW